VLGTAKKAMTAEEFAKLPLTTIPFPRLRLQLSHSEATRLLAVCRHSELSWDCLPTSGLLVTRPQSTSGARPSTTEAAESASMVHETVW